MKRERKQILHVSETMASGVLRYIQEAVRAGGDGAEHTILCSRGRAFTPSDVERLFPASTRIVDIDFRGMGTLRTLFRYIRENKPDAVHLHSSIAGAYGRIVMLMFPGIPTYYTPHGYSFLMTNKSSAVRALYWGAEWLLSHGNSRVVACSPSEYRQALRLSGLRKPALVENSLHPPEGKTNGDRTVRAIIGIGRMEEQKNPLLFVAVAALVRQEDPSVQAVWVGDGRLRESCERVSRELGAEVRFTGWLSHGEAMDLLQRSAVFVQTAKWEGLPYSVLEAFATGVPVVASDIESHRDLFESGEFRGFVADSAEAFAEYTLKLVRDPQLVTSVSRHNQAVMMEKYERFRASLQALYQVSE